MSKVKFVKVSSFYPEYLDKIYAENPSLKDAPYAEQYAKMMEQGIGWADYWVINLNKSGLFDATLFINNNEFAQKKWAEENQFKYNPQSWKAEIITEQIRRTEPELFFANDYVFLNNEIILNIKKQVPSIQKVLGWDGIGMCDADRFAACDVMFSSGQHFADYYISKGKQAKLFQFGFESTILNKIDISKKMYPISFAGSLTLRKGGHHDRLKLLGKVARHFDVDYWLSSFDNHKPYLLKNLAKKLAGGNLGDVYDILNLWRINKGNVYGLEMYQVLAHSTITLNSHIDTAVNIGGNIRLWEATGVGTCILTDWKDNMAELFVPDKEVVTFQSPDEAVEKIKWLLANPKIADTIAKAGQKRTLETYSYEKRMNDLTPFLMGLLA